MPKKITPIMKLKNFAKKTPPKPHHSQRNQPATPTPMTPGAQSQRSQPNSPNSPNLTRSRSFSVVALEDETLSPVSSENLAKLPTLTEEEMLFFKLVKDGDLVGLKDFMETEAFSKVYINKTDKFGYTALHHSVKRQDEEMTELFLSQPNILTFDTVFHAIEEENITITKMLLEFDDKMQRNNPPLCSLRKGKFTASNFFTPSFVGVPAVLSPTNLAKQQQQELAEFDSEFPTYFTHFLVAARKGNFTLMQMFYDRGERLESEVDHHNCGCPCVICKREDRMLSGASERLNLFEAITNPNYICFITGKSKNIDPVSYAIEKIKKCRELRVKEHFFDHIKYDDLVDRLQRFILDLVDLCRSDGEVELFFNIPEDSSADRLLEKHPRLWTFVETDLIDVVAHNNSQYIANKLWGADWPPFDQFWIFQVMYLILLETISLVFRCFWMAIHPPSSKSVTPARKYLSWVISYVLFLGVLTMQVMVPQRCNDGNIPYTVPDSVCQQKGAPTVGTEWVLVLYVVGFLISMIKRNAIPWFWSSVWTWYELINHLLFLATFGCWVWAYFNQGYVVEPRKLWSQYAPEVLADIFLTLSCIMAFGRVFRLIQLSRIIGPFQLALAEMMRNFVYAVMVYFTIIMAFSTGLNAIYVPFHGAEGFEAENKPATQHSPFGEFEKAPKELFWSFYGLSGKDKTTIIKFTDKIRNSSLHHPHISEKVGKLLYGFYHVVGVLMMLNMLVAYFSQGADKIMQNKDAHWKFARTQVYMTYLKDTVLPPPFNIFPTAAGCLRCCLWFNSCCPHGDDHVKASCSWRKCCFISNPENVHRQREQKKDYRRLVLELIHRFKGLDAERNDKSAATSDDVREIGEELAELRSQILSRMREFQKQAKDSKNAEQNQVGENETQVNFSRVTPTSFDESSDNGGGEGGEGGTGEKSVAGQKNNLLVSPITPQKTVVTPKPTSVSNATSKTPATAPKADQSSSSIPAESPELTSQSKRNIKPIPLNLSASPVPNKGANYSSPPARVVPPMTPKSAPQRKASMSAQSPLNLPTPPKSAPANPSPQKSPTPPRSTPSAQSPLSVPTPSKSTPQAPLASTPNQPTPKRPSKSDATPFNFPSPIPQTAPQQNLVISPSPVSEVVQPTTATTAMKNLYYKVFGAAENVAESENETDPESEYILDESQRTEETQTAETSPAPIPIPPPPPPINPATSD